MGEVYRATDTRLDRTVAIKVLPEHVSSDSERRQRFEREAKTLAALSHPHICSVFDVGSQTGIDFLVMEYLEGETLEQRLKKGPLPLDQALHLGIQIASALAAAHRAGIIHRDLKPGNVMLTKTGAVRQGSPQAKLLDFGLAKSGAPAVAGSLSLLPTTPPGLTAQGTIFGTFHYMAPEQLEGHEADARADIFAFGLVVYEMVTGKKAFDGRSQASLIGAIMNSDPAPISASQPLAPIALDRIVRTCLAKDPDDRWQSAGDIERQLKWIADSHAQATAGVGFTGAADRPRPRRTLVAVAVASLIAAFVTGAGLWTWATDSSATPSLQRVSLMLPGTSPITFTWSPGQALAISPDGTKVAYTGRDTADADAATGAAGNKLFVRALDSLDVRLLPGTDGAVNPFFSPDGQWVGFFSIAGRLALKKVSLAGGIPVTLLEGNAVPTWGLGLWLEDGTVVFNTTGALQRVPSDGGSPTALTTLEAGQREHAYPTAVERSGAILFTVLFSQLREPRIEALRLDSGERRVVVENARVVSYLDSGHLLFTRDETLLVAPFDPRSLTVTGPAVPLIEDVRRDGVTSEGAVPQLAVSRGGTLAYARAADAAVLEVVNRNGAGESLGAMPDRFERLAVSPNGQYVAFSIERAGRIEVFIRDIVRGTTMKLTNQGREEITAWHPNSLALALFSEREKARGLFVRDLSGTERLLVPDETGTALFRNGGWSPDGRLLAYTLQKGGQHDIWVVAVSDQPTPTALINGPANEHSPRFSPDGRWLAYYSDESGRGEVYVRGYPDGARFSVSTNGGTGPIWAPDGKGLFFQSAESLMTVSVELDGNTLRLGKPVALFDMRSIGPTGEFGQYANSSNGGRRWDVMPDGRFAMIRVPDARTREIVLVQNWYNELERLAPANR